ncbi:MAG TPA: polyprenol monophosphomannose synthase [Candidatus Thermoplasmatota archaeon]|nr:polyprenol monophosphomannose synthase [Candidatus Thermoplasmatota archaeon]
MRATVVLPTYREAANIGALLRELRAALGPDVELLVVDDDSPDGTAVAAAQADVGARVIVRKGERGLGSAVLRGIREAAAPFVLVMDADGQHPVEAVARMVERAGATSADLVLGSRYASGGGESVFTTRRRAMSRGAAALARLFLPQVRRLGVSDPMSGLFLVRKQVLDGIELRPTGFKILLEVLGRAPVRSLEEVGYTFQPRRNGESKLGTRVMAQYLLQLARLSGRTYGARAAGAAAVLGAPFAFWMR